MSISEKTPDELRRIADRLHKSLGAAKRLLWELQQVAIEKGSHKKIWTLAKQALKNL